MPCPVVVIDDDSVNNLICEKVILSQGLAQEVKCFLSADEALSWLCKQHSGQYPELIFLDINLPGMNGWEFLEQLNQTLPDHGIRIYMLSSSVSLDDQFQAQAHPTVTDFVIKPLTKTKLAKLL